MKKHLLRLSIQGSLLLSPSMLLAASDQSNSKTAACKGAVAVGGACDSGGLTTGISQIINTIFFIIGTLAVIVLLVGAIRYITSTGDAKRIQQAKDTIFYALAGLIVAILARAIVGFVIGKLA